MILLLKNLAFTVLVPGTMAGLLPYLVASRAGVEWPDRWGLAQWIAMPVLTAGVAIYTRCVWDFAHRGRATPLPLDAPQVLVVSGLYRYVRNPMYFGVLFVLAAEALFFESWAVAAYGAAWWLLVSSFVVFYEESALARMFGQSYADYKKRVHRWMPRKP